MIDLRELLRQIQPAVNGWIHGSGLGIINEYLMLPELRGFWPFSSINESGNPLDLSGQARTLTNTGTALRTCLNNRVNYFTFNGSSQYLTRASETGLNIAGHLTIGAWVWFNTLPGASVNATIVGKYTGSVGRSYLLYANNSIVRAIVSTDGTATKAIASSVTCTENRWYFTILRYTPSTELAVWVDTTKSTLTAAVPASLYASGTAFEIGRYVLTPNYLDGRVALPFVCASALSDVQISRLYTMTRVLFGA